MQIAVYLKSVRGNIRVVATRECHLERACLTRIQVSTVDVGEITPNDSARSSIDGAYRADIIDTSTVVIADLTDDLIPTKSRVV